ncbi:hypothetical protein OL548_13910 [Lysinibacillus sp. MHQ-1]|nr:hypothetical protein OL548_13910 [Lysinibacillus sp. MHQ-1]
MTSYPVNRLLFDIASLALLDEILPLMDIQQKTTFSEWAFRNSSNCTDKGFRSNIAKATTKKMPLLNI